MKAESYGEEIYRKTIEDMGGARWTRAAKFGRRAHRRMSALRGRRKKAMLQ
jgi:hypothetical protein